MQQKKHLVGGTLHEVMVAEVKRVIQEFGLEQKDRIAVTLGITPRTLRIWLAGWEELKANTTGAMEKVIAASPKTKKKNGKKKKSKR